MEIIIGLFFWVLGSASSQVSNTIDHIATLPPQPEQSKLACRDSAWEKQNLNFVDGSLVHKNLAPYLDRLLADSRKSGHNLIVASAYRNCSQQAIMRLQNCGDLNIKPIEQCSIPTEPAGRSLHNEGLALDFACQGYTVFSTSSCYNWVKQNAKNYRLLEHSLEPWHWSTTGK